MNVNKCEVLIVAAIALILAALLIPQFQKAAREQATRQAKEVADYNASLEYQAREQEAMEWRRLSFIAKEIYRQELFNTIANAIYWAEGGPSTKFPYGIKSVPVSGIGEARQVCLRTIENAYALFDPDKHHDFITFLGRRYCPPSVDPQGHINWVINVRFFVDNPKPLR